MEKHFGTCDLYKILELEPAAQIQDGKVTRKLQKHIPIQNLIMFILVKTSYYRLARIHHPDRVADTEKDTAKEKFNILRHAYSVLVDPTTRKAYDAGATFNLFANSTALSKWDFFIQPINDDDIETARRKYQGSSLEENDIIRETIAGKGSLTHLLNTIPHMRIEDEARIIGIVKRCMEAGKVPSMPIRKMR